MIRIDRIREVTPPSIQAKNRLSLALSYRELRMRETGLLCWLLPFLPRCWFRVPGREPVRRERWVTKIVPPQIAYLLRPFKIKQVDVYFFSGEMEGTIVTKFKNDSQPGYTYEKNLDTGKTRNKRVDEASNNLLARIRHILNHENVTIIDNISKTLDYIEGNGIQVDVEGGFRTTGLGDYIKQLWNLLVRGFVDVHGTLRATVTYNFLGKSYKRVHTFDVSGKMEVENAKYHLWK